MPVPVPLETPAVLTGAIEAFLEAAVAELEPPLPDPRGPGRPRLLPSLCLWGASCSRCLCGQRPARRLAPPLGRGRFPAIALSDQAVYRRLAREARAPDPTLLERLFQHVTAALAPRLAPFADATLVPWAADAVALGETTLERVRR